jgi:neutral ceramidase
MLSGKTHIGLSMSEQDILLNELLTQGKSLLAHSQFQHAYECFQVIDQINNTMAENLAYLSILSEHLNLTKSSQFILRLQTIVDEVECVRLIETAFLALDHALQSSLDDSDIVIDSSFEATHRAAFLQIDITPQNLPIKLQGYWTSQARYATQIVQPLLLQMMMIEDTQGTRCLFVSADAFAFDPAVVKIVRHHAAFWNIEAKAVFLNASHTHYAPCTLKKIHPGLGEWNTQYTQMIAEHIVNHLPIVRQRLRKARLEYQVCEAHIGLNRRVIDQQKKVHMAPNPSGVRFDHTPLLKVTLNNQQTCLMVNHGCHPTGYGSSAIISSDFVGSMRSALKTNQVAHQIMFLQGVAGNIKQAMIEEEQARWITPVEVEQSGHRLAQQIMEQMTDQWKQVEGLIYSHNEIVSVKLNQQCSLSARHSILYPEWKKWQKANTKPQIKSPPLSFELSSLKLGSIYFVSFEGEPVSEWGHIVQEIYGKEIFVLGYTNGIKAYLPTEKLVKEGGYEGDDSHLVYLLSGSTSTQCEASITKSLQRQYKKIAIAPTHIALGDHDIDNKIIDKKMKNTDPCKAFFVLSTGRSGTQTLAHLLEEATNAKVWHHPEPNLIHETKLSYWDEINNHSTFWQGRGEIIAQAWEQGLIHGETDHNMTPFAHTIADDIPNSKFLVLIRDPREFVRSGMRRGYYVAGGPWDEGRLKPHPKSADHKLWSTLTSFEKVCWLWAETYRHIERRIQLIGAQRVKIIPFHKLVQGPKMSKEIFDFLELDGYNEAKVKQILSHKLNAQRGGQFPHPREWNQKLHDIAWAYCGTIAEKYGYPQKYSS